MLLNSLGVSLKLKSHRSIGKVRYDLFNVSIRNSMESRQYFSKASVLNHSCLKLLQSWPVLTLYGQPLLLYVVGGPDPSGRRLTGIKILVPQHSH